ncbi:MAG TPA: LLM class flavin-dependent oxidoreductase, partial [Dehalococcoidia bacterium]|nr:LLM class flavin-dependent oxidoreductase [Dehalococcoidia bacterium]
MKVVGGYGETSLSNIPEQAKFAESMGVDAITTGEVKRHSLLSMTLAVEHTENVEICTGVTIVFPRSPMIMAQACWDLQEYSKGRINIGLGSQVKGHNLRRFAGSWTPPYQRMKDYIGMMRAVWKSWQTGEKPEYVSENYAYTLMTPNFDPGPIDYPFPKI